MQLNGSAIYQTYTSLNRTNSTRYLTEILPKLLTVAPKIYRVLLKLTIKKQLMKQHQETNATVKTGTTAHLMVTAKQVILYINVLPQRPLMQTKYTQEQLRETSRKDTTTTRHHSKNREKANDTTLSKHVWEVKDKYKETPSLKWLIVKSVPGYSNITKNCSLCLDEKPEIINYTNQEELLKKRSELISKCRHVSKYLLSNYKSNNQSISKIPTEHYQFVVIFKITGHGNVRHIRIFSVK